MCGTMRETERGLRMEAKERQYYVLLSALCTTYTQSIDQQIAKWINPHYLKVLEYIRKAKRAGRGFADVEIERHEDCQLFCAQ